MNSFTKLFHSIITSTIWTEDDQTRIVWITMLAIADRNGEVQGSVPGLARIAGVNVEACRAALAKFLSPDPDSRTKDDQGRRIEEIDGGWHLLNHSKYREMASDADRKEKATARQARKRKRDKEKSQPVTPVSRQNPQADAEAEAKAEEQVPVITDVPPLPPKDDEKGRESLDLEADGLVESKTPSANVPTTEQSKRIAIMFHRRLTTPWTRNEKHAYKQLGKIPEEDLAAVERYYSELWPPDREKNILRHDLVTFLRNFQGEVDRAHSYSRKAAKEPVKRESEFSSTTIKRL